MVRNIKVNHATQAVCIVVVVEERRTECIPHQRLAAIGIDADFIRQLITGQSGDTEVYSTPPLPRDVVQESAGSYREPGRNRNRVHAGQPRAKCDARETVLAQTARDAHRQ